MRQALRGTGSRRSWSIAIGGRPLVDRLRIPIQPHFEALTLEAVLEIRAGAARGVIGQYGGQTR